MRPLEQRGRAEACVWTCSVVRSLQVQLPRAAACIRHHLAPRRYRHPGRCMCDTPQTPWDVDFPCAPGTYACWAGTVRGRGLRNVGETFGCASSGTCRGGVLSVATRLQPPPRRAAPLPTLIAPHGRHACHVSMGTGERRRACPCPQSQRCQPARLNTSSCAVSARSQAEPVWRGGSMRSAGGRQPPAISRGRRTRPCRRGNSADASPQRRISRSSPDLRHASADMPSPAPSCLHTCPHRTACFWDAPR